ncbi:excinuclease ABC subunit UvrA [Brachybacterium saurashtrense]|uniref:UvrABC system protein A n=1 Tax=Brachybacterium saurashtrense TaxID=556288 RepID=A0A345YLP9_9MICO|nr:excinuclease ABC subunit UvrA [Brachybacterium saurashtrense]AXK44851.1 excinuclease ABC subunit UvrA [Brachybacterium saurashtrense]RRR20740.1 excinuclease ABC subunit UvrA [Brachybacterium saurashtrense]
MSIDHSTLESPIIPGSPVAPGAIHVQGARVHNLKNVDVEVPLQRLVAIAGVSGSGKSSLAMGVLYAEGSRRYIEALSTYTRRRMSHATRAAVDSVRHVPAALALRQRPAVPGVRSTFGTSTELLNVLRVMFSRLGSHLCPNGHRLDPTIDVAANLDLACPACGAVFYPPGAEVLAFNSDGACETCSGTGTVREIDDGTLIPDPTLTIEQGAVAPWKMFGLTVMPQVVAEFGVRTDVAFAELTDAERDIVLHGPEEKGHITVPTKNGKIFELNFTFRNARLAVQEAMDKATTEKGLARVNRFITAQTCPACRGTRLSEKARGTRVAGIDLAAATAKTLDEAIDWVATVPDTLPVEMHPMARMITGQFTEMAQRLVQLGLGYLALDRASSTLSTGERQRVQLARAVRNQTTGVLYVLDEPSIGLHPANVDGLIGVMRDLLTDGNSVVLVDHDVQVLREADWMIEIGPGSGAEGGTVLATGTVADIAQHPESLIGGFLDGREPAIVRERIAESEAFARGAIEITTAPIHTVHALHARIPVGCLTAVTGMSGSGKTTLVLDSLVPALRATAGTGHHPSHVTALETAGITRVDVVDATPIGTNVRSTVATYSGVLDDLRRAWAATDDARSRGLTAADFSYNTGSLRCVRCEGTGQVVLDVQFLPDVDIPCPDCHGTRYSPAGHAITRPTPDDDRISLPDLLGLTVRQAIAEVGDLGKVRRKLQTLIDLGLGYLTLGEDTPALSGGEAQRLKLATELGRDQSQTLFVLDEPSVGLHPLDTRVLLQVLERLRARGATIIVIEHDLDMIANADHVIDLGPGGGTRGGRIVATGTPEDAAASDESVTGRYLVSLLAANGRRSAPADGLRS